MRPYWEIHSETLPGRIERRAGPASLLEASSTGDNEIVTRVKGMESLRSLPEGLKKKD
jgi:hypothetical protein